jgi:hypothetical protein
MQSKKGARAGNKLLQSETEQNQNAGRAKSARLAKITRQWK